MKIEFEKEGHLYKVDGIQVPSVTQVLEDIYREYESVPAHILEPAQEFGTHVHEALALHCQSILDREDCDAALLAYVDQWQLLADQLGLIPIASERRVANPVAGYAGTADFLGTDHKGALWLIDFKTGVAPRTVGLQTVAYKEAYEMEVQSNLALPKCLKRIKYRACVELDGERELPKLRMLNDDRRDLNIFLSTLNCWKFKHGKA